MKLKYIAIALVLALMGIFIFLYKMVEISDRCGPHLSSDEVKELTPLAERGDVDACSRLRFHYSDAGQDERGLYWLRKGAAYGDPNAQVFLFELLTGYRKPQYYKDALAWLEKAAINNYPPAQLRMGELYKDGGIVDPDLNKAAYWFQKGANNGYRHSMLYLSELMTERAKIRRELIEAYKWTMIALSGVESQTPFGREVSQQQETIIKKVGALGDNAAFVKREAERRMRAEIESIPKYEIPEVPFGSRKCR
jgi:hypothetical protein